MPNIFLTSDLHLCHDREFLFKPRGFDSIDDMNNAIVNNWNTTVNTDDEVYILGDIMLNDNEKAMELLKTLNGRIHIILGNHDTDNRVQLYNTLPQVIDIKWADMLNYNKFHFFLSHFPSLTGSLEHEYLRQMTLNLFGHTHSKNRFYNDMPYMYNVAMDAHGCTPVHIDQIIEEMKSKIIECKNML